MGKKILVVDDEEHVRQLFKEELTEEGYEVILAADGPEAIRLVDEVQPDLVTLGKIVGGGLPVGVGFGLRGEPELAADVGRGGGAGWCRPAARHAAGPWPDGAGGRGAAGPEELP